jgi:hypothetical protein
MHLSPLPRNACLPLAQAEDDMAEIRAALAMPGSDVRALCERIRTLRQTEESAAYLFGRIEKRRTP